MVSDTTKTLRFYRNSLEINFNSPINMLELLNANKININQSCGGHGTCTTCRIFVTQGAENLSQRTELEQERAEERNFSFNERLACQTVLNENCEINIPT